MKKTIILLFLIIVLLVTNILTLFFLFKKKGTGENEFSRLEKGLVALEEDLEFYKDIDIYFNLLNNEDSKYIENLGDELGEKIEDDFILYVITEIFKDEKAKEIIENLRDSVNKKRLSETEKENLFSKNNACAELASNAKEQLKNKYKIFYPTIEEEKFEFIFYSPTMKSCLYSTQYNYSNSAEDYYSKTTKIIYNASTQSEIDRFTVSAYKHPYINEEDTKKAKKNYVKFILENSGYNIDLLKDANYIY